MTSQHIPPPQVALARRRYAEGATTRSILAESSLSLWSLYRCLDGFHDDGSGMPLPRLPRRREIVRRAMSRAAMIDLLWRNAQQQVQQIEQRMQDSGFPAEASERDARALAVLVRTLRELAAFDAQKAASGTQRKKPENEKPIPRNVDEMRRQLSKKLAALADGLSRTRSGSDGAVVGPERG